MKLDATLQPGQRITSCVWVCYLGEDLCAKCVLEMPHGSKVCASTLAYHRDRGDGGNSQSHAANFTVSVGHTRRLSMQLKLEHPGYQQMQLHEDAPPVDILLGEGSVFRLDPQDEMRLPRVVDGSVFRGAFFHGMRQGLPAGQISCGFVFRCVDETRDVTCDTRRVIPLAREVRTRTPAYDTAEERWRGQAPQYAALVQKRVREALCAWHWGPSGRPLWLTHPSE